MPHHIRNQTEGAGHYVGGKTLISTCTVWVWLLFLLFSQTPAYAASATLTKMGIAAEVDMRTMAPKKLQTHFPDTASEIWATAFLKQAPAGTTVSARWYFLTQGSYIKIEDNKVTTDGSRCIAFRLKPNKGKRLPVGEYHVDFYVNNEKADGREFKVSRASTTSGEKISPCPPTDAADEKLVVALASKHPEIQKKLRRLKLMRYTDSQKRFSLIVPGGWFQPEHKTSGQALFLSENKENNPIAWFSVSVFNVHLSAKFGALDAVRKLRDVLVKEGKAHAAEVVPGKTAGPEKIGSGMARANLFMVYKTPEGKEVAQLHTLLVDGRYAFDIQLNAQEETLKTALFLLKLATRSIRSENLCRALSGGN